MAPELLMGATKYGVNVDCWSAGCVLAEVYLTVPMFYGFQSDYHQLEKIYEYLGTPTTDDVQNMNVSRTRLIGPPKRIKSLRGR